MSAQEKSRSQRKREVEELQRLGLRLAELSPEQLRHIDIPGELREAVEQLRAITTRGARRRQVQYIGALMRAVDVTDILAAFEAIDRGHAREVDWERRIERWRDRLAEGDETALEEIVRRHPDVDRQQLRQLARNARLAPEGPERTRAARSLFRFLRGAAEPRGRRGVSDAADAPDAPDAPNTPDTSEASDASDAPDASGALDAE